MSATSLITKLGKVVCYKYYEVLSNFTSISPDEDPVTVLEPYELDREAADAKGDRVSFAEALSTDNIEDIGAALAVAQEEHRIRRDYAIAEAGHRELILSGLRLLELRNDILKEKIKDK